MLLANILYEEESGVLIWHAVPALLGALCVLAIAYRYYSAFLAAKVVAQSQDDQTPSSGPLVLDERGRMSGWLLFGRHFAAISGAGPIIGPVLAIQYGYMPGLLWLVIGACLAGAVQDMLVMAASLRRGERSLIEIARTEVGQPAAGIISAAILLIVIIALGAFGLVFVKALGGDEFPWTGNAQIILPQKENIEIVSAEMNGPMIYRFPENCRIRHESGQLTTRSEEFLIETHKPLLISSRAGSITVETPPGSFELIPGSSWGIFAIACTIPISLLMGWYITDYRKGGGIVAALVFGVIALLAAVIAGNWVPGTLLELFFSLTKNQTIIALACYSLSASLLPAWLLSSPRDYLSGVLKIGMLALLLVGLLVANPRLQCPPLNHQFLHGGPIFQGSVFPFLFICVMGSAISGFHALVCSSTTSKNERGSTGVVSDEWSQATRPDLPLTAHDAPLTMGQIRTVGYGAMLLECVVGIVALIAAASLDPRLYYDINISSTEVPKYQRDLDALSSSQAEILDDERDLGDLGDKDDPSDLGHVQTLLESETLRGRTGGAVTFAVGMAQIFTDALAWTRLPVDSMMKYWYHFAVVLIALFILKTIDAGTRIARSLLQEALVQVHPKFGRADWPPAAVLATIVVTLAWAWLVKTGSMDTIWPMFGIASQLLAVSALAVVTTLLMNSGKARYVPVTLLPMLFITTTAMWGGWQMVGVQFPAMIHDGQVWTGVVNMALTVFVMICAALLLLLAVSRWVGAFRTSDQ
jgi:carbon starvation protein